MRCISCGAENRSSLVHCGTCGSPLPIRRRGDRYRKRIVFFAIAVLLIWVAGFTHYVRDFVLQPEQTSKTESVNDKVKPDKKLRDLRAESGKAEKKLKVIQDSGKEMSADTLEIISDYPDTEKEVVAGWVVITDPWGRQVNKFRAGVTGKGWLALPTRACLGGKSWGFYPDSGQEAAISGGLWINGDAVGLWHVADESGSFDGPELASWNEAEPLSWVSLESANEHDSITLRGQRAEGFFISSSVPEFIDETGIFMQDGNVVGWSFGHWLPKVYMWPGKAGAELEYNTWVRYFYDITFANSREEKFAMALAMPEGSAVIDKLRVFIEGFQLRPRLALEDTPEYILPGTIIKQMNMLVANAVYGGQGSRIVDMLSSDVLKDIGNINLLINIVPAIANERGFEAAIHEIEDTGRYIIQQLGQEVPALNKLHLILYQNWLQSLVTAGTVDEGWQTFNSARASYPQDPLIHLLGVEVALLSGNWEEAERLLYMRNYPPEFQDRFQLLALRITEMKGREEKIVIKFPVGSNRVMLTADMNGTIAQNFLVDTGATTVTIPSSTADALGLKVIHSQRTLMTASGVETVSEVIIESIEIDGWVEYNIRAVVLDIPERPGLGLLGLNFLSRFQMDMKPEEGTLLLTPR